jgi:hypothetical protein
MAMTPQVESRKHTYPYKTGLRSARFWFLNFTCDNQRTAPFSADSNTNPSISTAILLVNRSVLILVEGISGLIVIDTTYLDDTETLAQAIQYSAIKKHNCQPQHANSCRIMCVLDHSFCPKCKQDKYPPYELIRPWPVQRCPGFIQLNAPGEWRCPGPVTEIKVQKGLCTRCEERESKYREQRRQYWHEQQKKKKQQQNEGGNEGPEAPEQQDNDDDNEEPEASTSASNTKITVESLLN